MTVTRSPFDIAADYLYFERDDSDPADTIPYWNDPAGWARDCILWPRGKHLHDYQAEVMDELVEFGREAVVSVRGAGKTMPAALLVLWFALTRDAAGVDWKAPTTASNWSQLTRYLWPEIHKWAGLINWSKVGRAPFNRRTELLDLNLKLKHGQAFAIASDDPAAIEGGHAEHMLLVIDEAKSVFTGTWDAIEGFFSVEDMQALVLAISTPGEPLGRLYEIMSRRPGTEVWHPKRVTLQRAVDAGQVSATWAENQRLLWGEQSAMYRQHVQAEFASSDTDGVIPLAWIELAQERWELLYGDRAKPRDRRLGSPSVLTKGEPIGALGVDVAGTGEDLSAFALRIGNAIPEIRRFPFTDDTMVLTGYVIGVQRGHSIAGAAKRRDFANAVIDSNGIGSGVFDRVREQKMPCEGFVASAGTKMKDISGQWGFVNKRAAAWWNLREMLDPDSGLDVALPPDDLLTGDLVSPKYRMMSGGRIQIESKADIRKRIGRSTDTGDAVVQALWSERGQGAAFLAYWEGKLAERGGTVPVPRPRGASSRVKRAVTPVSTDEFEQPEIEPEPEDTRSESQKAIDRELQRRDRRASRQRVRCEHFYKDGVCLYCQQPRP